MFLTPDQDGQWPPCSPIHPHEVAVGPALAPAHFHHFHPETSRARPRSRCLEEQFFVDSWSLGGSTLGESGRKRIWVLWPPAASQGSPLSMEQKTEYVPTSWGCWGPLGWRPHNAWIPQYKEICKTSGGKIPAVVSKVQQLTDEKWVTALWNRRIWPN